MLELFNWSDEMILAIFNKSNPSVLLFFSIIGIWNNCLEQVALDKCHLVDLIFD
jgi:hypothetical protein